MALRQAMVQRSDHSTGLDTVFRRRPVPNSTSLHSSRLLSSFHGFLAFLPFEKMARPDLLVLLRFPSLLFFFSFFLLPLCSESKCPSTCDLALASYYISPNTNTTYIAKLFNYPDSKIDTDIMPYNPSIKNKDSIKQDTRINIPFSCDCIKEEFLGHSFTYNITQGDTYNAISKNIYANLTTLELLSRFNSFNPNSIPINTVVNVTVVCSCGDSTVSKDYGLFVTYPLRPGQTLGSVASELNFSSTDLIQNYNQGVNFSAGNGTVFVPAKDSTGSYRPLKSSKGISVGAIAGISIAVVLLLVLAVGLYVVVHRRKTKKKARLLTFGDQSISHEHGPLSSSDTLGGNTSPFTGVTVGKSVEFTYEELAKATNDFSMANKIGEGGFGAVYYAELRGEKTAIKKMDMKASKEFLAELKVLTHVHHLNLVRLVGYCTEGSLFLVYEYIENGNLSEHLRGSGKEPLSWSARVQIALDSARGLEYIHEHTVPVYIHRDIKSPNILIDKNFHAKVADFGLAKLTEVGSTSQTKLVGTFGYMPPEYAQYGDVSPKVDVYAFGVVLYEFISAKEAIVKTDAYVPESKGLVALFEDVLSKDDSREDLRKVVDPRLGDNYPIEAVYKMAQLAKACTHENPQLRPTMRSIVVGLMTLSSTTEDWDVGLFYENQPLVNLMSGR